MQYGKAYYVKVTIPELQPYDFTLRPTNFIREFLWDKLSEEDQERQLRIEAEKQFMARVKITIE